MLIKAAHSCLLLVDIQERLVPAVAEGDRVVGNAVTLTRAAARLGIPVLASEQYPKGLGPTVAPLTDLVGADRRLDKEHFNCADDPGIATRLGALERDQVVIAGMEAHVCVLQTALGLKAAGYLPYVVADAIASRTEANKALALNRLRRGDVGVVSLEMVLFEWLAKRSAPGFDELLEMIK